MTMTPTTATTMPMPMPTTTTTTTTMMTAGVASSSTSSPRSSLMCSTTTSKRKQPKSKSKAKAKTKTKLNSKLSLARGQQQQRRKSRRPSVFPQRLYDLLQKSDEATTADAPTTTTTSSSSGTPRTAANANTIIAWTPDGLSFRLFVEHHEESTIIQLFKANNFNLSKYKSFTKQLTLYNFKRICKGWYSHQLFQRGRPELFYKKSMKDFELAATGTKGGGGGGGASSLSLPASSSSPRPEASRPDDAVSHPSQQPKPSSILSATLFSGMALSLTESSRTPPASDDDTDADTTTTAMMDWALPTPVPPSSAHQHPHQPLLSSSALASYPANGSGTWRPHSYSAPTSVVSVSPPLTPTSSYHDFAAVPDPLATLSLLPSSTSTRFAAPAPAMDHQYYYADPSHGSTTNNASNIPSYRKQYKRVSLDNSVMSNCYTNSTSNSCNANANMLPAMLRSLPPSSNNSSNTTDLFNANMLPTMIRSLPPSSNNSSSTIDLFEDLFNFDNTYDVGGGGTTGTGGSGRGNNSTDNGSTTELEFSVVTANDIEDLVSMMVHEHDQPVATETHVRNTMCSTPPNYHHQLGNSSNRNDEQQHPQQHHPKTTTTTTIQFTANEMEMMTFGWRVESMALSNITSIIGFAYFGCIYIY